MNKEDFEEIHDIDADNIDQFIEDQKQNELFMVSNSQPKEELRFVDSK